MRHVRQARSVAVPAPITKQHALSLRRNALRRPGRSDACAYAGPVSYPKFPNRDTWRSGRLNRRLSWAERLRASCRSKSSGVEGNGSCCGFSIYTLLSPCPYQSISCKASYTHLPAYHLFFGPQHQREHVRRRHRKRSSSAHKAFVEHHHTHRLFSALDHYCKPTYSIHTLRSLIPLSDTFRILFSLRRP
jgi:hypothetical protein